jgi:hypothetical protein
MVSAICRSLPLFRFAVALIIPALCYELSLSCDDVSLRLESPGVFQGVEPMNLYPTTHHWTDGKMIDGGGRSRTTLIGSVYTSLLVSIS